MTANWVIETVHLASRQPTAELPVDSLSITSPLNGSDELQIGVPLDIDGLASVDIKSGSTGIIARRDNTVVGGGILMGRDLDVAANTMTLAAVGWHEWVRRTFLKQDCTFNGVDQATIIAWLVDYTANRSGGLPISTDRVQPTGRVRDRQWFAYERQSVGELIDNMSAVIDGCNFRYETQLTDEGLSIDFLLGYPSTGRRTEIVFDMGANVDLLTATEDASELANDVEMIGSGQGPEAPIVSAVNPNALQSAPRWEHVETHSDVSQMSTLTEKARHALAVRGEPITIPTLRIGTDVEPELGTYFPGDRCRVRGSYGAFDIDGQYVITQTNLVVSPDGEYVDLSVTPVVAS